jgi:hypothetical protein
VLRFTQSATTAPLADACLHVVHDECRRSIGIASSLSAAPRRPAPEAAHHRREWLCRTRCRRSMRAPTRMSAALLGPPNHESATRDPIAEIEGPLTGRPFICQLSASMSVPLVHAPFSNRDRDISHFGSVSIPIGHYQTARFVPAATGAQWFIRPTAQRPYSRPPTVVVNAGPAAVAVDSSVSDEGPAPANGMFGRASRSTRRGATYRAAERRATSATRCAGRSHATAVHALRCERLEARESNGQQTSQGTDLAERRRDRSDAILQVPSSRVTVPATLASELRSPRREQESSRPQRQLRAAAEPLWRRSPDRAASFRRAYLPAIA